MDRIRPHLKTSHFNCSIDCTALFSSPPPPFPLFSSNIIIRCCRCRRFIFGITDFYSSCFRSWHGNQHVGHGDPRCRCQCWHEFSKPHAICRAELWCWATRTANSSTRARAPRAAAKPQTTALLYASHYAACLWRFSIWNQSATASSLSSKWWCSRMETRRVRSIVILYYCHSALLNFATTPSQQTTLSHTTFSYCFFFLSAGTQSLGCSINGIGRSIGHYTRLA